MTREEARAAMSSIFGQAAHYKDGWIDVFVALGMLKLDDPESLSPLEALALSMTKVRDSGPLTAVRVNLHLESCGYQIVSKPK